MAYSYSYTMSKHAEYIPNSLRAVIVGSSGAGKTCLLIKMLLESLKYDKLYIFARSLYQPSYQCVIEGFKNNLSKENIVKLLNAGNMIKDEQYWKSLGEEDDIPTIESVAKALAETQTDVVHSPDVEFFNSPDGIPDPSELDRSHRNLIVFDDIMTDKNQTPAANFYTRGRSANCDCIYLSQNYTHLPLHTIRTNANFQVFFKSSPMVVEQLFRNFASIDMSLMEFKALCSKAWRHKFGFLVIDLTKDYETGKRYRTQLHF